MSQDQSLVETAIQQTLIRFPSVYAGAAAVHTEPGRPFRILAPCGIRQERLALWGEDVQVPVAVPGSPGQWQAKRLAELQPHSWRNAVTDAGE